MNPWKQRLDRWVDEGETEVGVSEWVSVTRAEADAFDRLAIGPPDFSQREPGPSRKAPVAPLYLVALLSKFASELDAAPIRSNEHATMLNYGYDDVRWHEPVYGGQMVRVKVTLADVEERDEGRYLMRHRNELQTSDDGAAAMTATTLGLAVLL